MDINELNLSDMALPELRRLQKKLAVEIKNRVTSQRKAALKEMKKIAQGYGIALEEIVSEELNNISTALFHRKNKKSDEVIKKTGGQSKVRSRGKTAGRNSEKQWLYFNPENPAQGWTGHGRRPRWVLDHLAQGGNLEDLKKK